MARRASEGREHVDAAREAERLDRAAELSGADARNDIQRASNYVLAVVLFAVALFFAGMTTKLQAPGLRIAMVMVAGAMFLSTVAWIATFPVSLEL